MHENIDFVLASGTQLPIPDYTLLTLTPFNLLFNYLLSGPADGKIKLKTPAFHNINIK